MSRPVLDVGSGFSDYRFGHSRALGLEFVAQGDDWCELRLPFDPRLIGDTSRGVLASGPIVALLDVAAGLSVWVKRGERSAHATLDMRIDYVCPAVPGRPVVGRGRCYRLTRSVAFVRGVAHYGDPHDVIANIAGTFMFTGSAS